MDMLKQIREAESGLSYDKWKYLSDDQIDWLIMQAHKVEELEKMNKELNSEIGAYAGTVEALTEEFSFLTKRMSILKNKMLKQNASESE